MERPSVALFLAFCLAQLISSIIAAYGDWGFTSVKGISGGWIGIVWIWNFIWFLYVFALRFSSFFFPSLTFFLFPSQPPRLRQVRCSRCRRCLQPSPWKGRPHRRPRHRCSRHPHPVPPRVALLEPHFVPQARHRLRWPRQEGSRFSRRGTFHRLLHLLLEIAFAVFTILHLLFSPILTFFLPLTAPALLVAPGFRLRCCPSRLSVVVRDGLEFSSLFAFLPSSSPPPPHLPFLDSTLFASLSLHIFCPSIQHSNYTPSASSRGERGKRKNQKSVFELSFLPSSSLLLLVSLFFFAVNDNDQREQLTRRSPSFSRSFPLSSSLRSHSHLCLEFGCKRVCLHDTSTIRFGENKVCSGEVE
jgi:hypothetical protein